MYTQRNPVAAAADFSTPPPSPMHGKPFTKGQRHRMMQRLTTRWILHTLVGLALFAHHWPTLLGWKQFGIDLLFGLVLTPVLMPWVCELLANIAPSLEETLYRCLVIMLVFRLVDVHFVFSTARLRVIN